MTYFTWFVRLKETSFSVTHRLVQVESNFGDYPVKSEKKGLEIKINFSSTMKFL